MKLYCLIQEPNARAFHVHIAPEEIVGDLKSVICANCPRSMKDIDECTLSLSLARKDGHWLPEEDAMTSGVEFKELPATSLISDIFSGELGKNCIHVLVRRPDYDHAKLCEARRAASFPLNRKRDWELLNRAIRSKARKDGRTAFSAVEYEDLPDRFLTDHGSVTSGKFYDLMKNATGINDDVLDDLMKVIETKTWAYKNLNANEETRVQFLSAIFEHVVCMFKDKTDAERVRLFVQSELGGSFVKANGVVDFRITRGTKTVCIMEAKNYDFGKGTAHAVLAMEAAADTNNHERVYGVVTSFESWHFLKRTDDAIERFDDSIRLEDPRPDVKRVAGRLYAMLKDQ
ncbi:hypothetical protein DYB32_009727 [Aphanomyces invadans]|uniref:Crinkler effector protein N-terminal domain-containing protein n=2 Tax=Aphanomyces invadans TaxID=157072 RepID=A0A3R6Y1C5_9STRA|nr:hypothetical protein DYB32_009727 [Aphanomyces invadans]